MSRCGDFEVETENEAVNKTSPGELGQKEVYTGQIGRDYSKYGHSTREERQLLSVLLMNAMI